MSYQILKKDTNEALIFDGKEVRISATEKTRLDETVSTRITIGLDATSIDDINSQTAEYDPCAYDSTRVLGVMNEGNSLNGLKVVAQEVNANTSLPTSNLINEVTTASAPATITIEIRENTFYSLTGFTRATKDEFRLFTLKHVATGLLHPVYSDDDFWDQYENESYLVMTTSSTSGNRNYMHRGALKVTLPIAGDWMFVMDDGSTVASYNDINSANMSPDRDRRILKLRVLDQDGNKIGGAHENDWEDSYTWGDEAPSNLPANPGRNYGWNIVNQHTISVRSDENRYVTLVDMSNVAVSSGKVDVTMGSAYVPFNHVLRVVPGDLDTSSMFADSSASLNMIINKTSFSSSAQRVRKALADRYDSYVTEHLEAGRVPYYIRTGIKNSALPGVDTYTSDRYQEALNAAKTSFYHPGFCPYEFKFEEVDEHSNVIVGGDVVVIGYGGLLGRRYLTMDDRAENSYGSYFETVTTLKKDAKYKVSTRSTIEESWGKYFQVPHSYNSDSFESVYKTPLNMFAIYNGDNAQAERQFFDIDDPGLTLWAFRSDLYLYEGGGDHINADEEVVKHIGGHLFQLDVVSMLDMDNKEVYPNPDAFVPFVFGYGGIGNALSHGVVDVYTWGSPLNSELNTLNVISPQFAPGQAGYDDAWRFVNETWESKFDEQIGETVMFNRIAVSTGLLNALNVPPGLNVQVRAYDSDVVYVHKVWTAEELSDYDETAPRVEIDGQTWISPGLCTLGSRFMEQPNLLDTTVSEKLNIDISKFVESMDVEYSVRLWGARDVSVTIMETSNKLTPTVLSASLEDDQLLSGTVKTVSLASGYEYSVVAGGDTLFEVLAGVDKRFVSGKIATGVEAQPFYAQGKMRTVSSPAYVPQGEMTPSAAGADIQLSQSKYTTGPLGEVHITATATNLGSSRVDRSRYTYRDAHAALHTFTLFEVDDTPTDVMVRATDEDGNPIVKGVKKIVGKYQFTHDFNHVSDVNTTISKFWNPGESIAIDAKIGKLPSGQYILAFDAPMRHSPYGWVTYQGGVGSDFSKESFYFTHESTGQHNNDLSVEHKAIGFFRGSFPAGVQGTTYHASYNFEMMFFDYEITNHSEVERAGRTSDTLFQLSEKKCKLYGTDHYYSLEHEGKRYYLRKMVVSGPPADFEYGFKVGAGLIFSNDWRDIDEIIEYTGETDDGDNYVVPRAVDFSQFSYRKGHQMADNLTYTTEGVEEGMSHLNSYLLAPGANKRRILLSTNNCGTQGPLDYTSSRAKPLFALVVNPWRNLPEGGLITDTIHHGLPKYSDFDLGNDKIMKLKLTTTYQYGIGWGADVTVKFNNNEDEQIQYQNIGYFIPEKTFTFVNPELGPCHITLSGTSSTGMSQTIAEVIYEDEVIFTLDLGSYTSENFKFDLVTPYREFVNGDEMDCTGSNNISVFSDDRLVAGNPYLDAGDKPSDVVLEDIAPAYQYGPGEITPEIAAEYDTPALRVYHNDPVCGGELFGFPSYNITEAEFTEWDAQIQSDKYKGAYLYAVEHPSSNLHAQEYSMELDGKAFFVPFSDRVYDDIRRWEVAKAFRHGDVDETSNVYAMDSSNVVTANWAFDSDGELTVDGKKVWASHTYHMSNSSTGIYLLNPDGTKKSAPLQPPPPVMPTETRKITVVIYGGTSYYNGSTYDGSEGKPFIGDLIIRDNAFGLDTLIRPSIDNRHSGTSHATNAFVHVVDVYTPLLYKIYSVGNPDAYSNYENYHAYRMHVKIFDGELTPAQTDDAVPIFVSTPSSGPISADENLRGSLEL